jgi:hypothetical protein
LARDARRDTVARLAFLSTLAAILGQVPPATRTALSGSFAWVVCVLLPSLHRAETLSRSAFALLPIAPVMLAIGVIMAERRSAAAPYALLTGYPISLALSLSCFDHDTALATFSPLTLAFALLSLAVYGAAAIAHSSTPAVTRAVEHKPLGEVAPVDPETRKQTMGTVVLVSVTLGALWLAIAGSWGTPARLREQWGRAAAEGATLTAVAAGVIGAIALAFVAPALRADRGAKPTPEESSRRLSWLLLVAVSGLVVYALLRLSKG